MSLLDNLRIFLALVRQTHHKSGSCSASPRFGFFALRARARGCRPSAVPLPPSSARPAVCAESVGLPPNINQPPLPSPCHRLSSSPQSCSANHQPPTFFTATPLLDVCYILRRVQNRWLALQKETKGTSKEDQRNT